MVIFDDQFLYSEKLLKKQKEIVKFKLIVLVLRKIHLDMKLDNGFISIVEKFQTQSVTLMELGVQDDTEVIQFRDIFYYFD